MVSSFKEIIEEFGGKRTRALEIFNGIQGGLVTTGSLIFSHLYPGTLWMLLLIAFGSYLNILGVLLNEKHLRHYNAILLWVSTLAYSIVLIPSLPYSYFELIFYFAISSASFLTIFTTKRGLEEEV